MQLNEHDRTIYGRELSRPTRTPSFVFATSGKGNLLTDKSEITDSELNTVGKTQFCLSDSLTNLPALILGVIF